MRYDYFLIWGNGLKFKNQIINEIENDPNFQIIMIYDYKPKSIKKLVEEIYSYDYAPFWHLKSKTDYLLKTIHEVEFIFVKNLDPQEDYVGEGDFRHIESLTVKQLKEKIRDTYNERKENRRTEEHVIHASDNEKQTNHILEYLNKNYSLDYLSRDPNKILNLPYHVKSFNEFKISEINITDIFCNVVTGPADDYKISMIPLEKSPHFLFLCGNIQPYSDYLKKYRGNPLNDYYSKEKFEKLSKNFRYLEKPYLNNYILVEKVEGNKFVIRDGFHRAAILKFRGYEKIIVAEIL